MAFVNPGEDEIRALLRKVRTVAIIGASPRPERPSNGVMQYLQEAGYRTIPVRPGGGTILGETVVESLAAIQEPVDLVDVFRASEHVPIVVEEAIAAGAPAIWLQEGVVNEEAAETARAAGLVVVMDRCAAREHARLIGASDG